MYVLSQYVQDNKRDSDKFSEVKDRRFSNSLNLERVAVENKIIIGMIE